MLVNKLQWGDNDHQYLVSIKKNNWNIRNHRVLAIICIASISGNIDYEFYFISVDKNLANWHILIVAFYYSKIISLWLKIS